MPRRFPPLCTGNCVASNNGHWSRQRLGRPRSNAPEVRKPCLLQRKRPRTLRERASGVNENRVVGLLEFFRERQLAEASKSSLDALDLPTGDRGRFSFWSAPEVRQKS